MAFYVQDERSYFLFQTKRHYMHPAYNVAVAWQETSSRQSNEYMHSVVQCRGGMDGRA